MKSRPAASCVGGPAWSKAQGSESCPVGVRRFKSCPTHLVETGRGHCHPAPFLDIDTRSGPSRGNSRGHENRLDSRVESVGGGHHLQRHPRGRQSDQVRGGTSGSPNDRLARDGSVPSGRGPSHRVVDLSGAGARCAGPHNRTRDRFRGRPWCTCRRRFVWLPRCSALVGPRFRDDPSGPRTCSSSDPGYPKRSSSQMSTVRLRDGRRSGRSSSLRRS